MGPLLIDHANAYFSQVERVDKIYEALLANDIVPAEEILEEDVEAYAAAAQAKESKLADRAKAEDAYRKAKTSINQKIDQANRAQAAVEDDEDNPELELKFGKQGPIPLTVQQELQQLLYAALGERIMKYKCTDQTGHNPFLKQGYKPDAGEDELAEMKR